jgi:predicted peroxiredoxin
VYSKDHLTESHLPDLIYVTELTTQISKFKYFKLRKKEKYVTKMNSILKIIYLSIIFTLINSILFTNNFRSNIAYSDPLSKNIINKTKLVYHLSSDDPWRATVALSDSQTMLDKGFNVTLMLSIEGVQLGVKHPHHFLGLDLLTNNVTNFINKGGNLIICEVCLKIAGYNNSDIIDKAIIGTPQIMANLLNKTTVVDY